MIDLNRTLGLVKGGLFDSEQTWRSYLPEAGCWRKTAFLLTGPLIIVAAVAAYILGFLGSDTSFLGSFRPTIISTIVSIVMMVITAGVVAFVISALAGAFGGKNNFAFGLAATTFAFIPGYVGKAVTWLPWIGFLLSLGLFVYAFILLWKVIPIYLDVPSDRRVGHYILSLLATFVVLFILSMTLGRLAMPLMGDHGFADMTDEGGFNSSSNSGFLGGITRQVELMDEAEKDKFSPPKDGRLSEKQVNEYIRVMQRTEELQLEKSNQFKALADKADNKEEMSLSDLSKMMRGVTEIAGLHTLEIEVVKSAGGNWAEHRWVHDILRAAWIQKDINEEGKHNYQLFQDQEAVLLKYVAQ